MKTRAIVVENGWQEITWRRIIPRNRAFTIRQTTRTSSNLLYVSMGFSTVLDKKQGDNVHKTLARESLIPIPARTHRALIKFNVLYGRVTSPRPFVEINSIRSKCWFYLFFGRCDNKDRADATRRKTKPVRHKRTN